ncbi:MAG: hypothetical protein KatS3mg091_074 [Patescibacteria group bacterium]|nr:MAG: hypothetical protein KatS3mg091_074 [Patescibacteria group bacterium]
MFYSDQFLEKIVDVFREGYLLVSDFGRSRFVLPYVRVNSFLRRADNLTDPKVFRSVLLKQSLSKILTNQCSISFVTYAASPHTTEKIVFNQKTMPGHFIVWWMKSKNKSKQIKDLKRFDFIKLSTSSLRHNKQTIDLIAKNIAFCIDVFLTNCSQLKVFHDRGILSDYLTIYGLVGYSLPDSRKRYGFSRGSQSSPEGHLNIVLHQFKKYVDLSVLKKPKADEWLKHLGPVDTVVYNLFRLEISEINSLIIQGLGYHNFSVGFDKNWQIYDTKKKVSFFEGFYIYFDERLEISDVLLILSKLVRFYNKLYYLLSKYFKKFYQSFNLPEKQEIIRIEFLKSVEEFLLKIDLNSGKNNWQRSAEKFVDFTLSLAPTFLQVKNWVRYSKKNKENLKILYQIYVEEKKKLSLESYQNKLVKMFMRKYNLDKISASALLRMKLDLYKEESEWQTIQFTMPETISLSYLISDYIYKDGKVYAGKLSIAPRLMTQKGVFEDLAGVIIQREAGI